MKPCTIATPSGYSSHGNAEFLLSPLPLTCIAIPPATTSANKTEREHFLPPPTFHEQSSPGSRLTICLFGAQRAPNYAVIVKDRRIKLASRALGTARVDLATCGPVLARWLDGVVGAFSNNLTSEFALKGPKTAAQVATAAV